MPSRDPGLPINSRSRDIARENSIDAAPLPDSPHEGAQFTPEA
jgi:hypothetical protein